MELQDQLSIFAMKREKSWLYAVHAIGMSLFITIFLKEDPLMTI